MRAARVAAPGAQRITVNGILAVPDDFSRLRLLLLDEKPDGSPDGSWSRLQSSIPQPHANASHPGDANASHPGNANASHPGNANASHPGDANASHPGNANASHRLPYEANTSHHPDGVRGTAWIVLPAHRRAYWLGVAADLRGQWVTAEVTVRPFVIPGTAADYYQRGISLDLSMLTQLPLAAKRN